MDKIYKIIGWVLGLLFLCFGVLITVSGSILAALPMVVAAALLLPPVRERVFVHTKYTLPIVHRIFAIFFLTFAALMLIANSAQNTKQAAIDKQQQEKAAETAKVSAELRKKNIEAFNKDPEKILHVLRLGVKAKQWESVTSIASEYLPSGNEEVKNIYGMAFAEKTKEDVEKKNKAAARAARQETIEKAFGGWGQHYGLERYIKDHMNDPSSYQHVNTTYVDNDTFLIVTTSYRGKNAFGGVVLNTAKAVVTLDGKVVQILK